MEIKLYNSFSEEVKKHWKIIEKKNFYKNEIFSELFWIENWYNTVGKYSKINLAFIVVFENNYPVMLFPFCINKKLGISILRFLGGDQSDYSSPLISKELKKINIKDKFLKTLDKILPEHDVKFYRNIPEYFKNIFDQNKSLISNSFSLQIDIKGNWNDYTKKVKKKRLYDAKRQRKRLQEKGELKFVIINPKENTSAFYNAFFIQKSKRYISTGVKDIFKNLKLKKFYKNFSNNHSEKIHLSMLMLDNEILATHWGVIRNKKFYFLMPTFNDKWSRYSPGRLLMEELIYWCHNKGFRVFDFTIGNEGYKYEWSNTEEKLYNLIEAYSWRGKVYLIFLKARENLKNIKTLKNLVLLFRKNFQFL